MENIKQILGSSSNDDKLPRKVAHLANAAESITLDDLSTYAFQAQVFTQASLPYRDPKQSFWVRRNGNFSLIIEAGTSFDFKTGEVKSLGLPFGSYPRLFLIWLTTEVLRIKKPEINLGDSLMSFMEELGLNGRSGGKTGTRTRLLDQLQRLLCARITFHYEDEQRKSFAAQNIAREFSLWKKRGDEAQLEVFSHTIVLDEALFQHMLDSSIPLDLRAVRVFQQSAFVLDLYAWLTYRIARQAKQRKKQIISWESLKLQFGCQVSRLRKFREEFKKAFSFIVTVYPRFQVAVQLDEKGLTVHPEDPAVLPKPRKLLP